MIDNDTAQTLVAGGSGAAVAAWLAKATGLSLAVMFFGGLSAAFFFSKLLAPAFRLPVEYVGAIAYVVGFVAILLLRKLHGALDAVQTDALGRVIVDWLRRLLGLPPAPPATPADRESDK